MIKINNVKQGFLIHESGNKFILCKVIKEYDNKEDAIKELTKKLINEK